MLGVQEFDSAYERIGYYPANRKIIVFFVVSRLLLTTVANVVFRQCTEDRRKGLKIQTPSERLNKETLAAVKSQTTIFSIVNASTFNNPVLLFFLVMSGEPTLYNRPKSNLVLPHIVLQDFPLVFAITRRSVSSLVEMFSRTPLVQLVRRFSCGQQLTAGEKLLIGCSGSLVMAVFLYHASSNHVLGRRGSALTVNVLAKTLTFGRESVALLLAGAGKCYPLISGKIYVLSIVIYQVL